MYLSRTFPTAYGPRSVGMAPMIATKLSRDELHLLVRSLERQAAEAERDGRFDIAETIGWRIADLREAAR